MMKKRLVFIALLALALGLVFCAQAEELTPSLT